MWKIEVRLGSDEAWIAVRLIEGPSAEEQAQREFTHLAKWMREGRGPEGARLVRGDEPLATIERVVPAPRSTGRFVRDRSWGERPFPG